MKLLFVCGPTSTGKTNIGVSLAKKFNGEIISADSRQVYKGLDCLTGKDKPRGARYHTPSVTSTFGGKAYSLSYYLNDGIRVWMQDVVDITQDFSVSHFAQLSWDVIRNIESRDALPIVVGGTGLYLSVFSGKISTLQIPPDFLFRRTIEGYDAADLQEVLRKLDHGKLNDMNVSDRVNPRRLIRAIEIARWRKIHPDSPVAVFPAMETLWIGLTARIQILEERIKSRIEKRWQEGVIDEVKQVDTMKLPRSAPALTSLGLSILKQYIHGQLTREEAIKKWLFVERDYAQRQLTWFRRQSGIHWFDTTDSGFETQVEQKVRAWYTGKAYDF